MTEITSVITNLFSGFAGVLVGGYITYCVNNKLETKKQKQKEFLICSVLNDLLKQTKLILNESLGKNKAISPYGYIKNAHEETKTIMPLFDNLIAEIGILPPSKNKTLIIQLYTELKEFLACNEKYNIKVESLRRFRKEMVPEKFIKLNCKNCLDYFDIDPLLFREEKNPNSVIDKDFFKAQKILIDDLNKLSDITMMLCEKLIKKIDTILNHSWEAKK